MAYSDFTLKKVKSDFNIKTVEDISLFSETQEVESSDYLKITLARNVPLAIAINTEKARSELIIMNILLEVRDKLSQKISLFSGVDFTVDKDRGLNGFCDYLISHSPEQFYVDVPVVAIVEAKNDNMISGLGQCVAEMYAATIYNEQEHRDVPCIYGGVTTGDEWKFLKLIKNTVYIDKQSYYLSDVSKIIGILMSMLSTV
jgi:hypothetical protein